MDKQESAKDVHSTRRDSTRQAEMLEMETNNNIGGRFYPVSAAGPGATDSRLGSSSASSDAGEGWPHPGGGRVETAEADATVHTQLQLRIDTYMWLLVVVTSSLAIVAGVAVAAAALTFKLQAKEGGLLRSSYAKDIVNVNVTANTSSAQWANHDELSNHTQAPDDGNAGSVGSTGRGWLDGDDGRETVEATTKPATWTEAAVGEERGVNSSTTWTAAAYEVAGTSPQPPSI